MKVIKKIISMLVAVCLMVGVANIPAYAKVNTISTTKTTDAVLSKTYVTPAQAVKKATTAKKTTTTKTTAKKTTKVTTSSVKKIANQSLSLINSLLKNKGTSSLAKTWLKKAKSLINSMLKGKKSNATKYTWLKKALTAIKAISKAKASTLSLIKQTVASGSVFSSLKTVLKNNITYKIYTKYGDKGINVISKISKKYKVSQTEVYNAFVKSGTTKKELKDNSDILIYTMEKGADIFKWTNPPKNINKALNKIKELINNKKDANNSNKNNNNIQEKPYQNSLNESKTDKNEPDVIKQINDEYGETGVSVISQLADRLSMFKGEVFNIFNKIIGVTKEQIEKAGSVILNLLKKGENFVNCASFAVGAYLNIDTKVAAVMNLASELSVNVDFFVHYVVDYIEKTNRQYGTFIHAEKNTLQKNGIDNVIQCTLPTLEDLMEGLQVGESAILCVNTYDFGAHAVTVRREKNGYGVFDDSTKEKIYTPENFKTLMIGEKGTIVEGIRADGSQTRSIVYYTAAYHAAVLSGAKKEYVIDILTNSDSVISRKI